MGEMKFKVTDGGTLRFYPMVKYVVEGVPEVPAAAEKPPTEEVPPAEEETPTPGFEALFAISGLLAVAYSVLRKK